MSNKAYCRKQGCPWEGNRQSAMVCECLHPMRQLAYCERRADHVTRKYPETQAEKKAKK